MWHQSFSMTFLAHSSQTPCEIGSRPWRRSFPHQAQIVFIFIFILGFLLKRPSSGILNPSHEAFRFGFGFKFHPVSVPGFGLLDRGPTDDGLVAVVGGDVVHGCPPFEFLGLKPQPLETETETETETVTTPGRFRFR
jgi:hypothetical protein